MEQDTQNEVTAFLSDPDTYHLSVAPAKIETHGAIVFLAGENVYKIKRNVSYPYMDFSTLEKRKAACDAEIEVNHRNAPNLYLGVIPITRDGVRLRLNGQGEVVEWAVHMRRFDEASTLDRLADDGRLTQNIIDQLAETIAGSHRDAPIYFVDNAAEQMEKILCQTLGELERHCGCLYPNLLPRLSDALWNAYQTNKRILLERAEAGHVRRCHGDLHLRNIVLMDNKPVLFDALEFDPSLATIDTLYDLSFLVMDLCCRELQPAGCRLLNRYLWLKERAAEDVAGLALFPFFLGLRACIRASVLAAEMGLARYNDRVSTDIATYLGNAMRFLVLSPIKVIAIGGLSGSGKSTISDLLAPYLDPAPGAVQLRSDIERKRHFGVGQSTRLGPEAYNSSVTRSVYEQLVMLESISIRAGRSVILDATFVGEADRNIVAEVARQKGVNCFGIWLSAQSNVLRSRIRSRIPDASDATVAVLEQQLHMDIGQLNWHMINASSPATEIVNQILSIVDAPIRADSDAAVGC